MQALLEFFGTIGGFMWGPWTFFVLMGAGVLLTLWTRFTQFKALTHGVAVVRGKYDRPDDPGAINHFQALSAALSATVGLGNIGGVALAVGAGGPGSIFWMWVIGFLGMAIKTVEVSLSMLYRDTDDPDDPHGGAMWVIDKTLGSKGGAFKALAKIFGFTFCVTLIISTMTGGNMFQSWSVATLTESYFDIPRVATGIVLAVIVGLVIVGGIKRIGTVAGKLVPLMCALYLLSAFAVLGMHITDIPAMLWLIVESAFSPTEATGAFLGGSIGWAFSTGLRRALFSNEAGQGSAPIAHSAAKTDEPVREGIVAGLEPFIDTICICTLTALVIIATGTWNRSPRMIFDTVPVVTDAHAFETSPLTTDVDWVRPGNILAPGTEVHLEVTPPTVEVHTPIPSTHVRGNVVRADGGFAIEWNTYTAPAAPVPGALDVLAMNPETEQTEVIGTLAAFPASSRAVDDGGTPNDTSDDTPLWGLLTAPQAIPEAGASDPRWEAMRDVFIVVQGDEPDDTGFSRYRLEGEASSSDGTVTVEWGTLAMAEPPTLVPGTGLFERFEGAQLTAFAFDRQFPGLGKWLVTIAAWLFAISTMISWSYYGEQGMIYMTGRIGVLPYKLCFLAFAIIAAVFIPNASVMEPLMDLGTGAMLWANMPIVLMMAFIAVRELDRYFKRFKAGEFHPHETPSFTDVVSGHDVEKD
jgi:AGCS family alanine or glycine:cation symporter